MKENLTDATSRSTVRSYYLEALSDGTNNYNYLYRHIRGEFDLDRELSEKLEAFQPCDDSDPYQCALPDLKLIRRKAFQRYSFRLAGQVNRRLLQMKQKKWWLWKDYALPRIGLAMPVGYSLMLDVPYAWIQAVSRDHPEHGCYFWVPWFVVVLLFAGLALFLIHTNVRDVIGDVDDAWDRTLRAFGIGLVWCGIYLIMGAAFSTLYEKDMGAFPWRFSILLTMAAFAFAVLIQFFFARSGSIADPL
jgi:uncharacterized protein YjeT (DUF2065 family)